ncbi:MAG: ankyrin repeat domain-containing protein [Polyangiaceae bacterium]|nr:ankyrin repeat domain-containing protein [Polyangiaceae bacterium]
MRVPTPTPSEWGKTRRLVLERLDTSEWCCPDWYDLVERGPHGFDHSSGGSVPPDTVVVVVADEAVALADALNVEPENLYAWDREYYLVLRVREVLDAELWRTLPWGEWGPGNVVHVWDKFHGFDCFRGQFPARRSLSHGGEWLHLERLVNRDYPPARLPERSDPPSPSDLLAAVRENDLARVEALLSQGVDPRDLGPPDGVRCLELGVSVARSSSPLWESIESASPAVTEALVRAGAGANAQSAGALPPLHVAVIARRPEHARVLLALGADPYARHGEKSALELAEAIDPGLAAIVRERC